MISADLSVSINEHNMFNPNPLDSDRKLATLNPLTNTKTFSLSNWTNENSVLASPLSSVRTMKTKTFTSASSQLPNINLTSSSLPSSNNNLSDCLIHSTVNNTSSAATCSTIDSSNT